MVLGRDYSQVREWNLEQVASDLASLCYDHDIYNMGDIEVLPPASRQLEFEFEFEFVCIT